MTRALRKGLAVWRTGALHRAAYGWELVVRSIFLVLILFIFRQLYSKVLPAGHSLAGFDQVRVLWYLVLTEAILTAAPRLGGMVDEEVRSGHVATFLARPIGYVAYHRWRFLGETAVSFPVNLLVASLTALALVGPPPLAGPACLLVLVPVVLGFLLHFEVSMALALSAFWVEDSQPFFWVYQKVLFILGGLLLPLDFFPAWVRDLAQALPFSLVLYGPARLTLDFQVAAWGDLVLRQLVWLVLLRLVTRGLFALGERRVSVHGG